MVLLLGGMGEARKLFSKVLAIEEEKDETIEMHRFGSSGNDVHKLDVLHSRQINRIMKVYISILILCAIYTIVSAILSTTIFVKWKQLALSNGDEVEVRAVKFPTVYSWFDRLCGIVVFFINFPLALIFTCRITVRNCRKITEEQFWIVILLFSSTFATFPVNSIVSINDELLDTNWGSQSRIIRMRGLIFLLQTWAANVGSLFYVWVSAHSYCNIDMSSNQKRSMKWKFRAPEFIAFVVYLVLALYAALDWKFFVDIIPFSTLPSFLAISKSIHHLSNGRLIFVIFYSFLELSFVALIWFRVQKTNNVLNNSEYLKCRSKQISFRFFIFNNILYHSTSILCHIFLHLIVPKYNTLKYLNESPPLMLNRNHDCLAALAILNSTYLILSAYVHLPPEAIGIRGWFWSDENLINSSDSPALAPPIQPITLKARELHSCHQSFASTPSSVTSQHRDSVVMETHCELFNFAWLAYEFHRMSDALDNTSYSIKRHIRCEEKDVHVLIIDSADRIIVSFRGTSSLKNIKTDLRIMPVPVNQYVFSSFINFDHISLHCIA